MKIVAWLADGTLGVRFTKIATREKENIPWLKYEVIKLVAAKRAAQEKELRKVLKLQRPLS